jgi:hypothetical protein
MTLQIINLGNYANDGTGDDLRTAFEKVNGNFDILRFEIAGATNLGNGTGLFAQKNAIDPFLEFKSLTSLDTSVEISSTATTVNLKAMTVVETDTAPILGGDMELNGHTIKASNGGGIESKIWNVDVQSLASLVSILMESNQSTIDMGYFSAPTGYVVDYAGYLLDMGTFLDPAVGNNIEFGVFNPMTG